MKRYNVFTLKTEDCRKEEYQIKNVYPVFLTITEDDTIWIEVPDFEILIDGTDVYDAIHMAREAIELNCLLMEDANETIPLPSDISLLDIKKCDFAEDGKTMISLIDINSTDFRRKTGKKIVKRLVELPGWLNYKAEQENLNLSKICEDALVKALETAEK